MTFAVWVVLLLSMGCASSREVPESVVEAERDNVESPAADSEATVPVEHRRAREAPWMTSSEYLGGVKKVRAKVRTPTRQAALEDVYMMGFSTARQNTLAVSALHLQRELTRRLREKGEQEKAATGESLDSTLASLAVLLNEQERRHVLLVTKVRDQNKADPQAQEAYDLGLVQGGVFGQRVFRESEGVAECRRFAEVWRGRGYVFDIEKLCPFSAPGKS